jgi:PAS domain-containing protein
MTEGLLRGNAESVAADRLARLELVLTAANLGAWEVDRDSSGITFDARARSILGIRPGHHPHWRDFLRLFPEADQDGNTQRWERSMQTQELFDLEGWWTLPGDPAAGAATSPTPRRRVRLRGRPLSGRGAATGAMVGVVWDVTAEHRLRERLSQSERLEALGLLARFQQPALGHPRRAGDHPPRWRCHGPGRGASRAHRKGRRGLDRADPRPPELRPAA